MKSYSKRTGKRGGQRSSRRRKQRGGQAPIPADVAQNIQDALMKIKGMTLTQLNLAITSGLIKYMTGMSNLGSQQAFTNIVNTYYPAIPNNLNTSTLPTEITAFSSSVDIPFAIFLLIIDKIGPIDNPQTVPTPTTIDPTISQKIRLLFSTLKTITPAEVKTQGEDSKPFFISMNQLPPDIGAKFGARIQEIIPQLLNEIHTEFTKFTPEVLVSYPVWPLIVKETLFSVGEMNPLNYLMMIGMKIIFEPILQEIQNQGSSTTTGAPFTTTRAPSTTTGAPFTTTRAPSTTTWAPATTTRASTTTTQSPLPIPAGIVAWLNANANKVPSNMVRNLNNAVSYIRMVFPTQTTAPLVQVAANKLIML
jgi:hypothetical protein